jgi:hypothetical protein
MLNDARSRDDALRAAAEAQTEHCPCTRVIDEARSASIRLLEAVALRRERAERLLSVEKRSHLSIFEPSLAAGKPRLANNHQLDDARRIACGSRVAVCVRRAVGVRIGARL